MVGVGDVDPVDVYWTVENGFQWRPVIRNSQRGASYVLIPLWIPALLAGAAALYFHRKSRKNPPGHCECGYDLTGNTSGVCPECGKRI